MRIVCIGGGPACLYFALLMKQLDPAHHIRVVERNRPYDTFGWGVVFSDATMDNMRQWDRETADAIEVAFNHWDDIELHFKGVRIRSGGHGFVGIGRKKLLNILQRRCEAVGVELIFETEADSDADYPDADLIIASDGVNSRIRNKHAEVFEPDLVTRPNRFIWLGTNQLFDAFNFLFEKTEHGWFQAHVYKFDDATTTFIVQTPETVWRAHGLDRADVEQSIAFCERLFAKHLGGHPLLTNARHQRGSAWLNFQRVCCKQWHHFNGKSHVVLMGDAVHTAHFAIGSGTKLALEDATELTRLFKQSAADGRPDDIPALLQRYQAVREVDVLRLQNAAWNAIDFAFAMQGLGSGPVTLAGSEVLKAELLPRVERGEWITAFALSEPDAGSDVAAIACTARDDGDSYVLDGEKTWISNGGIADVYCVFARDTSLRPATDGKGTRGISAFVVHAGTPGLEIAERIEVMAPHPRARLRFTGCRVPEMQRLGAPGEGFKLTMRTLDIFRAR
ncbi:MAG: acyl-CoA dehydrogenase family protein [Chitinophagaceae bacterium]|nr:acyl-CoA dehydrogenase family protein [Rubrivivax sp.]